MHLIHQSNFGEFFYVLRKLFSIPSVVLIGGKWKLGKTDFALLIAETLQKLKLITEVASNIYTSDHYPQITDLVTLKHWLYETRHLKLYILDEANLHLQKRRWMSSKNVEIIKLLPEISKAHSRMIIVGQELYEIDSILTNPTWIRGLFIKEKLKKVKVISNLLKKEYTFWDVPKTSIPFDPYTIAPLTENPDITNIFKDKDYNTMYEWAKGKNYASCGFNHPQQFNRWLRKNVLKLLEQHGKK